jgi:hypothetical protein
MNNTADFDGLCKKIRVSGPRVPVFHLDSLYDHLSKLHKSVKHLKNVCQLVQSLPLRGLRDVPEPTALPLTSPELQSNILQ